MNVKDPKKKLRIIIHSIVTAPVDNPSVDYVNESKLHNIVISEGAKSYHTKEVDEENSKGFFLSDKNLATQYLGSSQKSIRSSSTHILWPPTYLRCLTITSTLPNTLQDSRIYLFRNDGKLMIDTSWLHKAMISKP